MRMLEPFATTPRRESPSHPTRFRNSESRSRRRTPVVIRPDRRETATALPGTRLRHSSHPEARRWTRLWDANSAGVLCPRAVPRFTAPTADRTLPPSTARDAGWSSIPFGSSALTAAKRHRTASNWRDWEKTTEQVVSLSLAGGSYQAYCVGTLLKTGPDELLPSIGF